jgi:hypothetical protein
MFRTVRRPSSEALTVIAASGLHTPVATGRSHVRPDYVIHSSYFLHVREVYMFKEEPLIYICMCMGACGVLL